MWIVWVEFNALGAGDNGLSLKLLGFELDSKSADAGLCGLLFPGEALDELGDLLLTESCWPVETEIIVVHHGSFASHGMEWQLNFNGGHLLIQIGVTQDWVEEKSFVVTFLHIGLCYEEDVEGLEIQHNLPSFV